MRISKLPVCISKQVLIIWNSLERLMNTSTCERLTEDKRIRFLKLFLKPLHKKNRNMTVTLPGLKVALMAFQALAISEMVFQKIGLVGGGILADQMGFGKV